MPFPLTAETPVADGTVAGNQLSPGCLVSRVKLGDQLWELLDLAVLSNPVRARDVRHVVLHVHARNQAQERRT